MSFTGGGDSDPQYLVELKMHSDKLHTAIDKRIDEVFGMGNRHRPHRGYGNV